MLEKAAAIQRAGDKPIIFANWSYTYGKPYYFSNEWDGAWSATVGLKFPLFDGFKSRSKGQEAGAQLRQLRQAYEFQKQTAIVEVTSAWKSLGKARESLEAQEGNVELAKKTFEMFEEQYRSGLVSSLDVLDAEVMYSQARLGYISALKEYLVSRARLEHAVKGGSSTSRTNSRIPDEGQSGPQVEPGSHGGH